MMTTIPDSLSPAMMTTIPDSLSPAMTNTYEPLETACIAGNLEHVKSLIKQPFNIDTFLIDMIKARPQEWGLGDRLGTPALKPRAEDKALELVLTECGVTMSPDALNETFKYSCAQCVTLIPIFLELYVNKLVENAVSEGIITCAQRYQQLSLDIIDKCMDLIDETAFAASLYVCCNQQKLELLERLIEQYKGVPDLYQGPAIALGLGECCNLKDTNMARLLATKCGTEIAPDSWLFKRNILEYFFILSIDKRCIEITELILTEFGQRLKPCVLINAFGAACWAGNMLAIDLFIKTYGDAGVCTNALDCDADAVVCVDTPSREAVKSSSKGFTLSQDDNKVSTCAYAFSQNCMKGSLSNTKLMLSRCGGCLKFTDSHTFKVVLEQREDSIIDLQFETDYPIPCPCVECLGQVVDGTQTPVHLPCALRNIEE